MFDTETMEPYSLTYLFENFSRISNHLALYLPRSSDLRQVSRNVKASKQAQVIHYCTTGASRAFCVYYGDWAVVKP